MDNVAQLFHQILAAITRRNEFEVEIHATRSLARLRILERMLEEFNIEAIRILVDGWIEEDQATIDRCQESETP